MNIFQTGGVSVVVRSGEAVGDGGEFFSSSDSLSDSSELLLEDTVSAASAGGLGTVLELLF